LQRVSERERRFLTIEKAWALAMSGIYADCRQVLSELERAEPDAGAHLTGRPLRTALDDTCLKAREARLEGLRLPSLPAGTPVDEIDIWRVIDTAHSAYWNRDLSQFLDQYVEGTTLRFLAWVNSGGMTSRQGREAFEQAFRLDLEAFPIPNPYLAFRAARRNSSLSIAGDMAWAAFETVYPTAQMPGLNSLGVSHEARVLERRNGRWRISLHCILDDQFGHTEAPTWEVDAGGRVLFSNPAAAHLVASGGGVTIRAGRLKLIGAENGARLRAAITSASEAPHGIYSRYRAGSMVYEPDDGSGSTVFWVINKGSRIRVSVTDRDWLKTRLETATTAFGLSPSQRRLVSLIVQGHSLTEAAAIENITANTARTQLQRTFAKIGVRTQPGLVAAIIGSIEHAPMD
jgi:DNA-binding CsgD family transcriptional regulator